MKIAIDLNDVVRDFSNNFIRYYIEGYNHEFDLDDFEFWSPYLNQVFPFQSDAAYTNFVYNDFAFELFGKCDVCSRNLESELNDWSEKTVKGIESDEPIELMFVSTMEYGNSIGNTLFFLSKIGTKVRDYYFPADSKTIWDRCDVLITANPYLIEIKPEGKKVIKINTEYNKETEADYSFNSLSSFITNNENLKNLLNEKQQ